MLRDTASKNRDSNGKESGIGNEHWGYVRAYRGGSLNKYEYAGPTFRGQVV